jgi:hypothetical protein
MLEIFIDYYHRGLPPSSIWQQVSDSQLDSLVGELSFPIEDSQQLIVSIRVLLSCPRVRVKTIIRSIEMIQIGLPDNVAMQIVSELNSSIVDCCDIASQPNENVLQFVEKLLDRILSPCRESSSSSKYDMKGCIHPFEILPTLFDCIPAFSSITSIRDFALNTILSSRWPSTLVSPILKAFLESNLCAHEQKTIYDKISLLDSIDPDHLIGVIHTSLAFAEKYEDSQWLEVVRYQIDSVPDSILSDAFCVIEISFQTSPRLVSLVTTTLKTQILSTSSMSRKKYTSSNSGRTELTSSDFIIFLLAAQNDLYKDLVVQTLVDYILHKFGLDPSIPYLKSMCSRDSVAASECKHLLLKVVHRAEAASLTALLHELAFSILQLSDSKSCSDSGTYLGEYLVALLYIFQPHCRSVLLKKLFDALVENKHKLSLQMPYVRILKAISGQYLISLREHAQVMVFFVEKYSHGDVYPLFGPELCTAAYPNGAWQPVSKYLRYFLMFAGGSARPLLVLALAVTSSALHAYSPPASRAPFGSYSRPCACVGQEGAFQHRELPPPPRRIGRVWPTRERGTEGR